MVKSIQCFEDAKGGIHKDAYTAHRADLALWLKDTGVLNEGSASALADIITKRSNAVSLVQMLQDVIECAPDDRPTVATWPGTTPCVEAAEQ